MPTDRDRFETLLDTLDELREANAELPLLVEGPRDVAALRALGCAGDIVPINQGRSFHEVCEDLARGGRTVVVLTDWDRTGGRLRAEATRVIEASGGRVEIEFRRRIRRALDQPVSGVEDLFAYVQRNLVLHFRETVEEHLARGLRHPHARRPE